MKKPTECCKFQHILHCLILYSYLTIHLCYTLMCAVSNSGAQTDIPKLHHARFKTHMIPLLQYSLFMQITITLFSMKQLQPTHTLAHI